MVGFQAAFLFSSVPPLCWIRAAEVGAAEKLSSVAVKMCAGSYLDSQDVKLK